MKEATTLAWGWIKTLVGRFKWLLVACLVGLYPLVGVLAYDKGWNNGLTDYHGMCYHVGGMIVHKELRTVVECQGLVEIPKEEQKLLDKLDRT